MLERTATNVVITPFPLKTAKSKRIQSIDILRGIVMILMAIDHVRDYFHYDAFLYDPTDLTKTNALLFFTRWITNYCAPTFVFLAGISACLYGAKKSKKALASYLLTRGMWLIFVEIFILSLEKSFNPLYPAVTLQVIWAIGVCMIVLSGIIYLPRPIILAIAVLLIAGHNLLDGMHVHDKNLPGFLWAILHEPHNFVFGSFDVFVLYPVLPWIGVITLGYYLGSLYHTSYDPEKRKRILLSIGFFSINLFLLLRLFNIYGDPAQWSIQKNVVSSWMSFLNVTKYPPSLLYNFITLGPAMIFLALIEKVQNGVTKKLTVFGRVPFFYYIVHLLLIHLFAMIGARILGYNWSDMILSTRINASPALKGYGFNLSIVYAVWTVLVVSLYPLCQRFDNFKRTHQSDKPWLTYF
jgi:uncharacterized membrane protein